MKNKGTISIRQHNGLREKDLKRLVDVSEEKILTFVAGDLQLLKSKTNILSLATCFLHLFVTKKPLCCLL